MSLLRFAPYRDIAREIAARLAASRQELDPFAEWEEEVIVPSRGMAEAIEAELLERMPHGVAGLRIRFAEELAHEIVTRASLAGKGSPLRVASPAERRLAMRTAARASTHPMMESRGVASMLERTFRDMRDSGLSLERFAKRVAGARVRNPGRVEEIVRVWRDYSSLIERLGACDPADLLEAATAAIPSSSIRPQIVAGFYDMTGTQLAFVRQLHDCGRIAAIFVPSASSFVEPYVRAFGGELPAAGSFAVTLPQQSVTTWETRLVELQSVCRAVAALLASGVPPSGVGIASRSLEPYDVALLNRFAAEHGFRTTLATEMPLAAHRIGRAAITLLRIRERNFPRTEVLELLRDGLRVERRVDVEALDVATRQAQIAGGTSSDLQPFIAKRRELADYAAVVSEIEALTVDAGPELLARLGSLFRVETEQDLDAAGKLDEIAGLFASATRWKRGFDVASAIDAIENESLPAPLPDLPAGAPSIRVADLMRIRGRSFTHLFVVKMQDDLFPQRRIDDPLLPDSDRQRVGIRQIGDGHAEEQLLFELVSNAATGNVHFSTASGDGFGNVMRPSRFLRGIPEAGTEQARSEDERPARRRALQLLVRAGTRSTFDGYVTTIHEQVRSRLESISPTHLEDFGECPQKFFYKHILGIRDLDDPEHELQINARDKGILDHAILERFYRATTPAEVRDAAIAYPDLPAALAARLATTIDEEFARREQDSPPFNRTMRGIEQRATHRILREFVIHDLADLNQTALVPRKFEFRFGRKHRERADHPEPYVVEAGGVAINVEGTIDRIDQNADGRYRIVDYKSGKALRHKNLDRKIERGVRLQLALYAMAVADIFGADPALISGAIKPLVTEDINPAHYSFALHEQRDALLETLDVFVTSILAGRFPAVPSESDEVNACKYCPVNHSCRTRHDPEEVRALEDAGDALALLGGRANVSLEQEPHE